MRLSGSDWGLMTSQGEVTVKVEVEATGGDATDAAEDDEAGVPTVAETEVDRQALGGIEEEEWAWLNAEPEDGAGSVNDPVSMYLREIGRVELLTAQEERDAGAGEGTGQPPAGTGKGAGAGIDGSRG